MVAGHIQTVDFAMIKANASMESLELKVPEETLDEHVKKVRIMSQADRGRSLKNMFIDFVCLFNIQTRKILFSYKRVCMTQPLPNVMGTFFN